MKSNVVVTDSIWDGESIPTIFIDFLGQEVRVGDYIAYATTSSHSANIVVGQVLEFRTHDVKGEAYGRTVYDYDIPYDYNSRQPQPSHFQHTWKLRVQPLLDSRFSRGDWKTGVKKAVDVGTIMNVHKVDVSQVDIEVYE